jgi:hypothetical protein
VVERCIVEAALSVRPMVHREMLAQRSYDGQHRIAEVSEPTTILVETSPEIQPVSTFPVCQPLGHTAGLSKPASAVKLSAEAHGIRTVIQFPRRPIRDIGILFCPSGKAGGIKVFIPAMAHI